MSLGLAEYSYSRVLVCEIYSTQLILIMTSLERRTRLALTLSFLAGRATQYAKVSTSGPGPLAIGLIKYWLGRAIWGLTVRRRGAPLPTR